jgi:hypothetical protein
MSWARFGPFIGGALNATHVQLDPSARPADHKLLTDIGGRPSGTSPSPAAFRTGAGRLAVHRPVSRSGRGWRKVL